MLLGLSTLLWAVTERTKVNSMPINFKTTGKGKIWPVTLATQEAEARPAKN
jgi:hypothetical protein